MAAAKIAEFLKCSICLELPELVVESSCCYHFFCEKCVASIQKCPLCRNSPFRVQPSIAVRRLVLNNMIFFIYEWGLLRALRCPSRNGPGDREGRRPPGRTSRGHDILPLLASALRRGSLGRGEDGHGEWNARHDRRRDREPILGHPLGGRPSGCVPAAFPVAWHGSAESRRGG